MERGDVPRRGIQRLGYTGNPWILIGSWRGLGWGFRQGVLEGKWSTELTTPWAIFLIKGV